VLIGVASVTTVGIESSIFSSQMVPSPSNVFTLGVIVFSAYVADTSGAIKVNE